jgi:hypothetical protein
MIGLDLVASAIPPCAHTNLQSALDLRFAALQYGADAAPIYELCVNQASLANFKLSFAASVPVAAVAATQPEGRLLQETPAPSAAPTAAPVSIVRHTFKLL